MRTRATDVLRRPVPQNVGILSGISLLSDRDRLRILRRVWMLRASVNLELRDERAPQAILGQHARDRVGDHPLGVRRAHPTGARALDAAGEARVTNVDLRLVLLPG